MNANKTILAVLAHPDDESFGMGGTLAHYASQGVAVHLICATRGEAGEVDAHFLENYDSIAALRTAELQCAADTLGLAAVHFLDYRDSGMAGSPDNGHANALVAQPLDAVAAKIVAIIRQLRPQVVITFDPVGGYHHPDHIAIHHAAVRAFHAAGIPDEFPGSGAPFAPQKLYFSVFPRRFFRLLVRMFRFMGKDTTKFGRNQDINLEVLAGDEDYPIHARINYRAVIAQKTAADACHASQLDFGRQSPSLLRWLRKLTGGTDSFMRAHPPASSRPPVSDLFSG
ncbi:MAG: PIG-L family deacetylase [Anaerolineae bacterium]|nr:PIG-L family deacetylase [Anaerolineae bacterium]